MSNRVQTDVTANAALIAPQIFIHRGTDPQMRKKVLFHELTHFFAHPIYREWVATTVNERWYNEGFTEYIARMAMRLQPPRRNANSTGVE